MFDWWNVLGSVARVHTWAQILTGLFIALSASSVFLTFKTSTRIADLKSRNSTVLPTRAPAPAPRPVQQEKPVPAPAPKAVPVPAAPAPVAAAPAVAKPVAVVPPPAAPEKAQRHLAGPTREKLIALLKERPKGKVGITYMKGDVEAQAYSVELAVVLASAGWETVNMGAMADFPGANGFHFMIKNAGSEPENTRFIIHSFIEAGLKPNTELNKSLQEGTLLLVVGHK